MKQAPFIILSAIAALLIPGCSGGTGGDGDDNPSDTLSEAWDIAAPLAEDWDADALCFNESGFVLDSDGVLVGPETLAGEDDKWFFRFNAGGDAALNVSVHYDGTYETFEDITSDVCYPLPDYSDDHIKDLMNTADDAFQENLGSADYLYMLNLLALESSNTATVQGFNPDFTFAGWMVLDADTLEILDTSW